MSENQENQDEIIREVKSLIDAERQKCKDKLNALDTLESLMQNADDRELFEMLDRGLLERGLFEISLFEMLERGLLERGLFEILLFEILEQVAKLQ